MPEEVEEKASWLLQRLQAECCEAGAWVENKGIVLALHHEAWKEKTAIGENSIVTLYENRWQAGGNGISILFIGDLFK